MQKSPICPSSCTHSPQVQALLTGSMNSAYTSLFLKSNSVMLLTCLLQSSNKCNLLTAFSFMFPCSMFSHRTNKCFQMLFFIKPVKVQERILIKILILLTSKGIFCRGPSSGSCQSKESFPKSILSEKGKKLQLVWQHDYC